MTVKSHPAEAWRTTAGRLTRVNVAMLLQWFKPSWPLQLFPHVNKLPSSERTATLNQKCTIHFTWVKLEDINFQIHL